jgi:DNA-binding transcriptional ArsR family regulator
MKSAVLLGALIGFALINTAFLGVYLLSTPAETGTSFSGTANYAVTSTASQTANYTVAGTVSQTAASTQTALSTTQASSAPQKVSNLTSGVSSYTAAGAIVAGPRAPFTLLTIAQFFEARSLVLAPTSWFFVGGMWIWRGRMKSKWTDLGFDSDVFGLFVKMKGAKTRIRLLDALSAPKDRLQLAQELGLDWKAVDRHIEILDKYGFVHETVAYGKVRMYALTSTGKLLLQLLDELNRQDDFQGAPGVPIPIPSGVEPGS